MREHAENGHITGLAIADTRSFAAAGQASNGCIACSCGGRISLTPRQMDLLGWVAQGLANKAIAQRLRIAENTVRGYVSGLLAAFQVGNRTLLAVEVARRGLPPPPVKATDVIVVREAR